MFQWAQKTFDQISQTVAPPPQDGPGRFAYNVQRSEEDAALGCLGEFDPVYTVVNQGKGWYPIHMACQYSLVRLIRQLLNYPGMNIEQVDKIGNTPLHHACTSSDGRALEVVQFLVNEYGANVLAKNSQGQTAYDLASSNNVRQFLLPIQLQKETQIALDNGGQGLPPGIDLGGLRIKNSNMAPPPMSFGGSEPRAQSSSMYPPTPLPADPSKIASAPASMPPNMNTTDASNTAGGYSLRGSSSAAIFSSKYTADGFHSSSSDVQLQQKYGHDISARQYVTAPPPSSGNATSLSSLSEGAPISGNLGGDSMNNPFSRGFALPKQRYVSYGPTATQNVPSPTYNQFSPTPAAPAAAYNTFTPNNTAAQSPAHTQPVAQNAVNAPSTPFMPPPPYQTHNYESPSKQVGFVSPAAATYGGSPVTPLVPSKAPVSGGSAHDLFAAPANPPAAAVAAPAPISTGSAHELFATPQPTEPIPAETSPEGPKPAEEPGLAEETKDGVTQENQPQDESKQQQGTEETAPANEAKSEQTSAKPDDSTGADTSDWVETTDPSSGQVYYYNSKTQETSWEDPRSKASKGSSAESDWVETEDPTSGKVYYYNKVTHETSWEKPSEASTDDQTSDDEWVETVDPSSGQTYYYNQRTQETSWEKPASMTQDEDKNDAVTKGSSDWVETIDPNSGQVYYYNQVTHETSWEKPAAMVESESSEEPPTDSQPAEETTAEEPVTDSPKANDWMETVDPSSGQTYYYNSKTGETSWENPEATKEEESPTATQEESSARPKELERRVSAHDLFGDSGPAVEQPPLEIPSEAEQAVTEGSNDVPTSDETAPVSTKDGAAQILGSPSGTTFQPPPISSTSAQTFQPPPISSGDGTDTEKASETATSSAADVFGSSNAETTAPKEEEEKKIVDPDLSGEGEMLDVPLSPDPVPAPVKPIDQSADLFAAIGMPPPPFQSRR